jgi:hypothetical protein
MNKRIQELAEQVGLEQGKWANADRVRIWQENPDNPGALYRFAELIVKECVTVCKEQADRYKSLRKGAFDHEEKEIYNEGIAASQRIESALMYRFGVK